MGAKIITLFLDFDLHLRPHIAIDQFLIGEHGGRRPAEELFGGLRSQVEAAMTARAAIVVVPVCSMEGDPAWYGQ